MPLKIFEVHFDCSSSHKLPLPSGCLPRRRSGCGREPFALGAHVAGARQPSRFLVWSRLFVAASMCRFRGRRSPRCDFAAWRKRYLELRPWNDLSLLGYLQRCAHILILIVRCVLLYVCPDLRTLICVLSYVCSHLSVCYMCALLCVLVCVLSCVCSHVSSRMRPVECGHSLICPSFALYPTLFGVSCRDIFSTHHETTQVPVNSKLLLFHSFLVNQSWQICTCNKGAD